MLGAAYKAEGVRKPKAFAEKTEQMLHKAETAQDVSVKADLP